MLYYGKDVFIMNKLTKNITRIIRNLSEGVVWILIGIVLMLVRTCTNMLKALDTILGIMITSKSVTNDVNEYFKEVGLLK